MWFKKKVNSRCIICNKSFNVDREQPLARCPFCGYHIQPCIPTNDRTIKINLQELGLLTMCSEQWALKLAKENEKENATEIPVAIASIAQRLHKQLKLPAVYPLTSGAVDLYLNKQNPNYLINSELVKYELLAREFNI